MSAQPTEKKLTRKVSFRLSEEEYAHVLDELTVSGLSLSALIRKRILGERVASRADLAVLAELRRLGGLLKHVYTETGGIYSQNTADAIEDISKYVKALTERTKKSLGELP
jgi:hypothetical protein